MLIIIKNLIETIYLNIAFDMSSIVLCVWRFHSSACIIIYLVTKKYFLLLENVSHVMATVSTLRTNESIDIASIQEINKLISQR